MSGISLIRKLSMITFGSFILLLIGFSFLLLYKQYIVPDPLALKLKINGPNLYDEEFIQYQLSKNLINYAARFVPILLAVFSGIFFLFTYITNLNLKKSEILMSEVRSLSDKVNEQLTYKYDNYSENLKRNYERMIDKVNEIRVFPDDIFRNLMVLFNRVIPDNEQVAIMDVTYLVSLMDEKQVCKSSLVLGEKGTRNSIKYMEQWSKIYKSHKSTEHLSIYIDDAIKQIKERIAWEDQSINSKEI